MAGYTGGGCDVMKPACQCRAAIAAPGHGPSPIRHGRDRLTTQIEDAPGISMMGLARKRSSSHDGRAAPRTARYSRRTRQSSRDPASGGVSGTFQCSKEAGSARWSAIECVVMGMALYGERMSRSRGGLAATSRAAIGRRIRRRGRAVERALTENRPSPMWRWSIARNQSRLMKPLAASGRSWARRAARGPFHRRRDAQLRRAATRGEISRRDPDHTCTA